MVRDDVYDGAEPMAPQFTHQPAQSFLTAEFGIDSRRIDNVIAVQGAGPCCEDRRQIKVGYPKRGKIGNERSRIIEGKAAMKLQTHGGARQCHWPSRSASGFSRSRTS